MSPPQGICVAGMGRSGTSLVANLIAELGVAVGPTQEMLPPAPSGENPRGYWEQREIRALNDELLGHLGGGWYDILELKEGWELAPELDDHLARAKALIAELFGEQKTWAFKDPRASLTLPFWERVAGPFRTVICVRDPRDVASSLQSRDADAHPRWRSSAVWLAYTAYALEHTRGQPRLILHYEDLIADPQAQAERLAGFLGVEGEAGAAAGTVDPTLHHHRELDVDAPDPFLIPEALELHRLLRENPDDPRLDDRAGKLRQAGIARVGPVADGRLPALRGSGEADVADSERFEPGEMTGTIAAEHTLRYQLAARLASGREVLDAGCGQGYGTAIMAEAGATRAVGIDISEEAIGVASAYGGAEFVVGDASALPFEDDSFDLVACFEAIEHLVRRDDALDAMARVLRPGGLLLISTPNRLRYHEGNPHHVYEYEPEEFRAALASRFSQVRLVRQFTVSASIAIADEEASSPETTIVVPGDWSEKAAPGSETYTLALASDVALPELPALANVVPPDDPEAPENVAARTRERNAALLHRNNELQQANKEMSERNEKIRAKNDELRKRLEASAG